jgi:hypothetical protein
MKLEHNINAYIYSTLADRKPIIIRAGEYKVAKRESNTIGEEYVLLESTTNDGMVMTSVPLISATRFGRTELGIAIDGHVVFKCKLCGKGHPSTKKSGETPMVPDSLITKRDSEGCFFALCADEKACRKS